MASDTRYDKLHVRAGGIKHSPLAGYDIGPVVGIGTYGEVRCASHSLSRKRVAIKIVDLSRFGDDARKIIQKEVQMLEACTHPHVIHLVEVKKQIPFQGTFCERCACTEFVPHTDGQCLSCKHDGGCHATLSTRRVMFLVQELAAGGEIFGLIQHCGPFPEAIARYYFRQLVDGLEYLHDQGIVHRDLKPENLVLDAHFQLKIVDFGLAARTHEIDRMPDARQPQPRVLHSGVGSLPYSAPEVYYSKELYQSRGYNGAAADVWSCAVILFVMLTGKLPFLRPLVHTYGTLQRDKHFVKLLKGRGFSKVSVEAKEFLMCLFQRKPEKRLTLQEIQKHPWYHGPVLNEEELHKTMEEKSHFVWRSSLNFKMIEVLEKMRNDLAETPLLAPEELLPFDSGVPVLDLSPSLALGSVPAPTAAYSVPSMASSSHCTNATNRNMASPLPGLARECVEPNLTPHAAVSSGLPPAPEMRAVPVTTGDVLPSSSMSQIRRQRMSHRGRNQNNHSRATSNSNRVCHLYKKPDIGPPKGNTGGISGSSASGASSSSVAQDFTSAIFRPHGSPGGSEVDHVNMSDCGMTPGNQSEEAMEVHEAVDMEDDDVQD